MSDIEVVIKIPADVLERTMFYRQFEYLKDSVTTVKALEKAVPLPKGHGRLIDADKMIGDILTIPQQYEELADWCIQVINGASTIIEADKAESEVT